MVTPVIEGFSLSHAEVLDGTKTFLEAAAAQAAVGYDIYGVNDSSIDPDTGDYENEGDDRIMSVWSYFNYADLAVQAGYMSFPLIATLTGQTISSSGSGANVVYGLDLWHEDSFNVKPRPMLCRVPSRDNEGTPRSLLIGLYSVNFRPITFDGPSYKDGLKVNYAGRALQSRVDEKGVPFPDGKARAGRLLSIA